MIFKIERFAVPTVNSWTVTGMHIFLYFFFHRCHRLPQSVSEDRDQTELPSFVRYFIYDYNVPYTNGVLAALTYISSILFLLRVFALLLEVLCLHIVLVCLRYNNNHMYVFGTP